MAIVVARENGNLVAYKYEEVKIIKVRDLIHSIQFEICGHVKVISYDWSEETGEVSEVVWDSETCHGYPDEDVMEHEVTAMNLTDDGCLEIEYNPMEIL